MQIYRWSYKWIYKWFYSTSDSTIRSTTLTRDTALRSVTFILTFNPVTELRESCQIQTPFDKAVTDVLRNRHEQTFKWQHRSSIRLAANSTPKITFRSTHRSTSRSADQSTCNSTSKSTGRSAGSATLTLVSPRHSIISSFHWSCSTSELSIHKWTMAHLAGIDKGPVLDWTDDNSLMEQFRKWKKKVEILFWGPHR